MEDNSIYTEKFETLLSNKGYGTESQDSALTEILELMAKFPNFVFGEDINFVFTNLFIQKYDIREIGSLPEELFLHYWRETTNRLLIKYVPKIKTWLDNFNDLFKFTVELNLSDTQKSSSGTQNTYYLNPVNANTGVEKEIEIDEETGKTTVTYSGGNLKVQDIDSTDENGEKIRTIKRDVLQSVWGKTRANLMDQILKLEDIYNSCLAEFDTLFMGVF